MMGDMGILSILQTKRSLPEWVVSVPGGGCLRRPRLMEAREPKRKPKTKAM